MSSFQTPSFRDQTRILQWSKESLFWIFTHCYSMAARRLREAVAETRAEEPTHTFIRVKGVDEDDSLEVDSVKEAPKETQESELVVLINGKNNSYSYIYYCLTIVSIRIV